MILRERGRAISRLEAFSDAVFALSATLLVVSLEVPRTYPELAAGLKGFVAFGLSFAALILIWAVHNGFFRRYGLQDAWTVVVNSVLLFVVLFYVYPLKFVGRGIARYVFRIDDGSGAYGIESYDQLGALFVIYGLAFATVFLCFALLYHHAHRRAAALELDPGERHEARFLFRHYLLFCLVGLLSVLTAWAGIGLPFGFPGWIYGLIGPISYLHGAWSDRRRPGGSGGAAAAAGSEPGR
jgi:uncharacterized membrane protein